MTSNKCHFDADTIFKQAMESRDRRDFEHALQLCHTIVNHGDHVEQYLLAATHSQIAHMREMSDSLAIAEHHVRVAIELRPRNELYSLQMFHLLAGQRLWDLAMEEAVRYLRLRNSPEYADLFGSRRFGIEFEGRAQELLSEARRLLQQHAKRN